MYSSKLERVEVLELNDGYMSEVSVTRVPPLQRGRPYTLALNFTVLAPAYNNVTIYIESQEYIDKTYKKGFVQIKKPLCDFIEQDKLIYPVLKKNSNLPDKCPIKPGRYRFDHINVGQTFFLSAAPFRNLRLKMAFTRTNSRDALFVLHVYLTYVERKSSR